MEFVLSCVTAASRETVFETTLVFAFIEPVNPELALGLEDPPDTAACFALDVPTFDDLEKVTTTNFSVFCRSRFPRGLGGVDGLSS